MFAMCGARDEHARHPIMVNGCVLICDGKPEHTPSELKELNSNT